MPRGAFHWRFIYLSHYPAQSGHRFDTIASAAHHPDWVQLQSGGTKRTYFAFLLTSLGQGVLTKAFLRAITTLSLISWAIWLR